LNLIEEERPSRAASPYCGQWQMARACFSSHPDFSKWALQERLCKGDLCTSRPQQGHNRT